MAKRRSALHKAVASFFIAATCLLAACAQKPSDNPVASPAADLPGCKAASANVDYGSGLNVSEEAKAAIESYRSAWKSFCSANAPTDRPSLADLIVKAKTVEMLFEKIINAHNTALSTEDRYAKADAVSDLLVKKYPSFVPGFEGSYYEYEYFRPSTEEFRKHASLGTAEDRLFFDAEIPFTTAFPSWIEKTWDYGGCLRFGEFQWTEALGRIVQLKKSLQSDIYKRLTSDYEVALMESLTSTGENICTCGRKEAVMEDLQSTRSYLEKEPMLSPYAPGVRSTIEAIRRKKTTVKSEAEKHCSGG
jgi:hypothetical protein